MMLLDNSIGTWLITVPCVCVCVLLDNNLAIYLHIFIYDKYICVALWSLASISFLGSSIGINRRYDQVECKGSERFSSVFLTIY